MTLRSLARLALCIALVLVVGYAHAQPRDRAAGEALFRAGRQAADAGDWKTACQRFEESNRLDPAIGTVFNLGYCREQLGQFASAWQRYDEVVQTLPANDERRALAKERAQALVKKVPHLVLELSEAPEGTVVARDGVELGRASFGVPLPIDPGRHVVEVRAPGHEPRRFEVTLAEGETSKLALALGPVSTAAAPSSAAPETQSQGSLQAGEESSGSTKRTIGFIVGGVGVLAIAASLTAGGLAISKKDVVEKNCSDTGCTEAGLDAAEAGQTLTTVANIAFIVGAAGLGVGTFLVLTSDPTPESSASRSLVPTGAVLGMKGRF